LVKKAARRPPARFLMAWQCSSESNAGLVANLHRQGIASNPRVIAAMQSVDRASFCPRHPYEDSPQPIGHQATISAPHMHAMCLEALHAHLRPGMRALDVGSGTGYLTLCMALMVGTSGKVVGIEHVPDLVASSLTNVAADGKQALLDSGNLMLREGDGRLGCEEHGPYDAIHVGAAAPTLPPALVEQLKKGGRLIIPVGTGTQYLLQIDKDLDGKVTQQKLTGVRYVPLTDLNSQLRGA